MIARILRALSTLADLATLPQVASIRTITAVVTNESAVVTLPRFVQLVPFVLVSRRIVPPLSRMRQYLCVLAFQVTLLPMAVVTPARLF